MTTAVSALDAPPVERQIAFDMAKRALPVAPILVTIAGAIWGWAGAASAAFAVALVLLNFAVAAITLSWAARISLACLWVCRCSATSSGWPSSPSPSSL